MSNDYKTLVNIMLVGGNDGLNMLLDNDTYDMYKERRGSIALDKTEILVLNDSNLAVHSKLFNIAKLYNNKELAFVANVGPLMEHYTLDNYEKVEKPLKGSHNEMRRWVNSLNAGDLKKSGWIDRVLETIDVSVNYEIEPNNQKALNLLESTYKNLFRNCMSRSESITELLSLPKLEVVLKNDKNALMKSLLSLVEIIKLRFELGLPRQVYHVGVRGYDTHSFQKRTHKDKLYPQLDDAINDYVIGLKQIGMYNSVTTFITSDFGRTIYSGNNDSTDHGEGGHYFVFGGAVKGGKLYGEMPDLSKDSKVIKSNVLIPQIAWEQYVATISKWFGLSENDLDKIFPLLRNFYSNDLGFMK